MHGRLNTPGLCRSLSSMRIGTRRGRVWAVFAMLVFAPAAQAKPAAVSAKHCSTISGSARHIGMGYDHIIEVANQCAKPIRCQVWTDADPKPVHDLNVAAGAKGSVTTRRGSPSSRFAADGDCRF